MASPKGTVIMTSSGGGLGCAIASGIVSSPELVEYHSIYTVRNKDSPAINLTAILARAPKTH